MLKIQVPVYVVRVHIIRLDYYNTARRENHGAAYEVAVLNQDALRYRDLTSNCILPMILLSYRSFGGQASVYCDLKRTLSLTYVLYSPVCMGRAVVNQDDGGDVQGTVQYLVQDKSGEEINCKYPC